MTYRIYISDTLKLQGEGKYPTARYYDMINPQNSVPKKEKTADEIAIEVIAKAGLKVGD